MVEFCNTCKCSLPNADIKIYNGKSSVAPDYICPICKKPATLKEKMIDLTGQDVIISDGEIITER